MIIVCCGILLPSSSNYSLFLTKKVLAILVQCQVVGFSVKIIVKADGKRWCFEAFDRMALRWQGLPALGVFGYGA